MKFQHLNLTNRCVIEKGLAFQSSFREIAAMIGCSASTVMREVRNNREFISSAHTICENYTSCLQRKLCGSAACFAPCKTCHSRCCHDLCKQYVPQRCELLDKAPYVCTGCTKQNHCRKQHAYYSAYKADKKSRALLSESRKNIRASEEQTARLNELFTPLVLNGQSVSHIFANHSEEIDFSRRTIYNYIDKCVFDVRNIDLPRKVRYKKRKTKPSEPAQYAYRQGRTYADFKAFMESHPGLDVVEMDTVKGQREKGKCLLTMIFTKYDLMLIFLIESASQKCVQAVFDGLTEKLGTEIFQRLFPVILTDNGGEFKAPDLLENTDYGVRRTNIFYCQPMASWQKPHIERSHEFIRQVIPKGVSMDCFTQADITLMTNHINSVSRDSLGGSCPYDAAKAFIGRKLPKILGLQKIAPDDVILRPALLKR